MSAVLVISTNIRGRNSSPLRNTTFFLIKLLKILQRISTISNILPQSTSTFNLNILNQILSSFQKLEFYIANRLFPRNILQHFNHFYLPILAFHIALNIISIRYFKSLHIHSTFLKFLFTFMEFNLNSISIKNQIMQLRFSIHSILLSFKFTEKV